MHIQSLARRTDFIFSRFSGVVVDKGHYTLIQTPSNPGFHWGNYIVFDQPPKKGSLKEWTSIFDQEFASYPRIDHYVFTWESENGETGDFREFTTANFAHETAKVLTAKKLNPPSHVNGLVKIRKLLSDDDWAKALHLQVLCAHPDFANEHYEDFKRPQMENYRKMAEAGMGAWFGAFLGDKLVGDLGIFHEGDLGRYQSISTHPDYRRQGICGTLVFKSGQVAFEEYQIKQLVMEADADYHAARIYESVGFRTCELNHALCWWKGKP